MRLARQSGDITAAVVEAQRLLAPALSAELINPELGRDLRALALINLGIAELWTSRFDEADRHLADGTALAQEIGRPYLELTGLAFWAQLTSWRSFPLGAERGLQAIDLASKNGWSDEPVTGVAYLALGVAMVSQGRLEETGASPRSAGGATPRLAEPLSQAETRVLRYLLTRPAPRRCKASALKCNHLPFEKKNFSPERTLVSPAPSPAAWSSCRPPRGLRRITRRLSSWAVGWASPRPGWTRSWKAARWTRRWAARLALGGRGQLPVVAAG
jgi:hypothetical protein